MVRSSSRELRYGWELSIHDLKEYDEKNETFYYVNYSFKDWVNQFRNDLKNMLYTDEKTLNIEVWPDEYGGKYIYLILNIDSYDIIDVCKFYNENEEECKHILNYFKQEITTPKAFIVAFSYE